MKSYPNILRNFLYDSFHSTNSLTVSLIRNYIITLVLILILGIFQSFDSKGPLILTIFGAMLLVIRLSGIQTKPKFFISAYDDLIKRTPNITAIKSTRFIIIHSHHNKNQRESGHEFQLGNKYFCTGCYGILIGTIVSIIITIIYGLFGLVSITISIFFVIIPFCFLPIILRYTFITHMKTFTRLLSNILLPIGCCLLFITVDYSFESWSLNLSLVVLIVTIAMLRGNISKKNANLSEISGVSEK